MTSGERRLLEGVSRRAEATRKIADIALASDCYIPAVMAVVSINLVKTLILLCGRELYDYFLGWLVGAMRNTYGLCVVCGEPKATFAAFGCDDCVKDMENVDREIDVNAAMDRKPEGGVS